MDQQVHFPTSRGGLRVVSASIWRQHVGSVGPTLGRIAVHQSTNYPLIPPEALMRLRLFRAGNMARAVAGQSQSVVSDLVPAPRETTSTVVERDRSRSGKHS
jgi:hypothetical protein